MKKSLLAFIALYILFSSCSKTSSSLKDHEVFRYNESANITSLDPIFSRTQANIWANNQLYNSLVQLSDSLEVVPDIAKSWTISEDGTEYTFLLRQDVYFHESSIFKNKTRTVNASDVAYSFSRLQNPELASPGNWILRNVNSFNAVNDSVFKIKLHQPFAAFLGLLSMKYASVVPREAFETKDYNFAKHPIGTGPFSFKIWEENIKLVLRKNPLYFEKDAQGNSLPYLEAVAITFLPDKQSGFLQFIQGKQDLISGLDPSYKDDILTSTGELQSKYQSKIKMISGPYLNTEYLGINANQQGPLSDKSIRKALNIGFDRQKMITYLRNNMGTPATAGFIPYGLPGFLNEEIHTYQPELAQELVDEYKKKNNVNKVQIQLSTNASYIDISEYLQREWKKIGIDVSIDVMPPSALRQAMATNKVDFFRGSWIADYPDAENYLSLFYSKNKSPNGPNYTHFKNEKFDKLYEDSNSEINVLNRLKMYQEMDKIVMDESYVIPLFYDKAIRFTSKNVEGLGINPLNSLQLKNVKKTPKNL